ncbi:MAG: hypothetical protein K6G11_06605, partial [Lachnospiraceae bacterium]|nr:hypothetical protein [Lachnospiraceae bacterium]
TGTLTVNKRNAVITAGSATKVYDATALRSKEYEVQNLADGDSVSNLIITGSRTEIGRSSNIPSEVVIIDANNNIVTDSYSLSYVSGNLTVTGRSLEITAGSAEKTYDGTALTSKTYKITDGSLSDGDIIESIDVEGTITKVGETDNTASNVRMINGYGKDVTNNYDVNYVNGTLKVNKRDITITANSQESVYTGEALKDEGYKVTDASGDEKAALASGDSISKIEVTGEQTEVGSSANVASGAVITNSNDENVTDSYNITYVDGTLSVYSYGLEITAVDDIKVYDGKPLTGSAYKITGGKLIEGDYIDSIEYDGSQINVGSSEVIPANVVIKNAEGKDVTVNYALTYKPGTLSVSKKLIAIKANDASKVYDATPLTMDGYIVTDMEGKTENTICEGDSISEITTKGSITYAGTTASKVSNAKLVNEAGEDVTANYDITYVDGELMVTEKSLVITADSAEKVYDGISLSKDTYTVEGLEGSDSVKSVKIKGSIKYFGTDDNTPSNAVIVDADGREVTSSYIITYRTGTLSITKKELVVTADSEEKEYDGKALYAMTYTSTTLVDGDLIVSATVSGEQVGIGSSESKVYDIMIINEAREDVTESYDITYVPGTLTIIKAKGEVIITEDISKTYDGEEVKDPEYTSVSTGEAVFKYYKKSGGELVELSDKPVQPGTYYVKAIVAGDAYTEPGESELKEFTIAEKVEPSATPTGSAVETEAPSVEPTIVPTTGPVIEPTTEPTDKPTMKPTTEPTSESTTEPKESGEATSGSDDFIPTPAPEATTVPVNLNDKVYEKTNPSEISFAVPTDKQVATVQIGSTLLASDMYSVLPDGTVKINDDVVSQLNVGDYPVYVTYTDNSESSFNLKVIDYDKSTLVKTAPIFIMTKTIYKGSKYKINLMGISSSAAVTMKSSNNKTAQLNQNGVVKGKRRGKAKITCNIIQNGATYKVVVKVRVIKSKKKNKNLKNSVLLTPVGELPEYNIYKVVTKGRNSTFKFRNVESDAKVSFFLNENKDKKYLKIKKIERNKKNNKVKCYVRGKKKGWAHFTAKITQNGHTYYTRILVRVNDGTWKKKQMNECLK